MICYEMKGQTDQALACFVLSICISAAVFISAFGQADMPAIEEARRAVAAHEQLLKQSISVLQQNQDALNSVRKAVDDIEGLKKR
jgi:ABC-type phosphate/phosphonate transport system permease subunit